MTTQEENGVPETEQERENLRILLNAGNSESDAEKMFPDPKVPEFPISINDIDMSRIPVTAQRDIVSPLVPVKGVKHYLHILEIEMSDGSSEYRGLVSPLSKNNTLRFIRNRLVVTKFGLDMKPCDYMDVRYLCNFFYDEAGKEIGCWHMIHSSSLADIGTYAPEIMKQLDEEELAKLIDSTIMRRLIDVTAENASLREQLQSFSEQLDQFFKGKYDIGGKFFEHIMNLAALLPESDRSKLIEKNKSIFSKIADWLNERPTIKMIVTIGALIGITIGVLVLTGTIRIPGG